MAKIKKPTPPSGKIPPVPPPERRGLSFSFRHFVNREPFDVARGSETYPLVLLERLRDLCSMTALELQTGRNKALRCHLIDWDDTTEPHGFDHLNQYLREQVVAYQFSVSSNEHGRVHGFFIDDVFYVVWLDPGHQLYSR